jgi:hypothetical protein
MVPEKPAAVAFVFFCMVVLSASVVHSDGNSPIEVGYAVITPTSTNTSGLVVFETFGLKQGSDTTQAGVMPSELTTDAVIFVNASGRLFRNLGLAIANPSAIDATVKLTLRDPSGTVLSTKAITLADRNQRARFVTELFSGEPGVPEDFEGTVTIHSTVPVAVIGLRFRGENFSTIPTTNLSTPVPLSEVAPGVGGPNAVILPHFATGGGWASEIVLANTGATSLTVRVDIFKQSGSPLTVTLNNQTQSSFQDLTIPPGGVVVLAPRDSQGNSDF